MEEKDSYIKVKEEEEKFINEIKEVYEKLIKVKVKMIFEDWKKIWEEES